MTRVRECFLQAKIQCLQMEILFGKILWMSFLKILKIFFLNFIGIFFVKIIFFAKKSLIECPTIMSRAYHIRASILFLYFIQYFFSYTFSEFWSEKKNFQNTDTYPSHHKRIFNLKDENFITHTSTKSHNLLYSLYITRVNLFYIELKRLRLC